MIGRYSRCSVDRETDVAPRRDIWLKPYVRFSVGAVKKIPQSITIVTCKFAFGELVGRRPMTARTGSNSRRGDL